MRGEQAAATSPTTRYTGPSPRARGAADVHPRLAQRPGSIPACAGSSCCSSRCCFWAWVHPRVRGEQTTTPGGEIAWEGPSPRARGAVPASWGLSALSGVHPRVRGEQRPSRTSRASRRGPSPRARGAASAAWRPVCGPGSIPACAGSRKTSSTSTPTPGVHPRVRGEQLCDDSARSVALGPSPRARGAEWLVIQHADNLGSIPACAGSRAVQGDAGDLRGVHPRVRGEQRPLCRSWTARRGPSPRARGAARAARTAAVPARSIPACAGSSACSAPRSWPSRVHPRVRGEQPEMRAACQM